MIPRFKPTLGIQEFVSIFLPVKNNRPDKFEKCFALKIKQKHAIAFPYGRTGLLFLLKALNLKGKEIICPSYTCVVVPHAIIFSENSPVFIDSCFEDFNMDLNLVKSAINDKTGAIICTSIFGNPVNLDQLEEIRKEFPHIYIIQDCAHSFGAKWNGKNVNQAGIAAIYGLNISKTITSVFGGVVSTDNDDLYEKLKKIQREELRTVGIFKSLIRRLYLLATFIAFSKFFYFMINFLERNKYLELFVKYFDETKIDMPKDYLDAMTPFEAKIGICQIGRYDKIMMKRIEIGKEYDQVLSRPIVLGKTYSHYPILVKNRDAIIKYSLKNGIQLGTIINYDCHSMACYKHYPFFTKENNVLKFKKEVINMPLLKNNNKINDLVIKLRDESCS